MLPFQVCGVAVCEGLSDGTALLIGFESLGGISLRQKDGTDPVVKRGEMTLPLRIAGILFG